MALIGLDVGTTDCKCTIFDTEGNICSYIIAKTGNVDISAFRNSPEYQYIKELFEVSSLNNQLFEINKAV